MKPEELDIFDEMSEEDYYDLIHWDEEPSVSFPSQAKERILLAHPKKQIQLFDLMQELYLYCGFKGNAELCLYSYSENITTLHVNFQCYDLGLSRANYSMFFKLLKEFDSFTISADDFQGCVKVELVMVNYYIRLE